MSAVNGRKPTGKLEPGQYGLDIHEVIDGSHKPDARKWTNQNVLYVDAQLDDVIAGFGSYRLLRLLLHLRRRIGNGKSKLNPGIDSIARVCRINKGIVIAELRMVKKLGYIEVQLGRRGGHQYRLTIGCGKLYIDPRLDDAGLSAAEIRVLAHMARLADAQGHFYINQRKFADVCGLSYNTVKAVLRSLQAKGYYVPEATRKNPRYKLLLAIKYPVPRGQGVKIGNAKLSKEGTVGVKIGNESFSIENDPIENDPAGHTLPRDSGTEVFSYLDEDEEETFSFRYQKSFVRPQSGPEKLRARAPAWQHRRVA